jgi:hypothetical protein
LITEVTSCTLLPVVDDKELAISKVAREFREAPFFPDRRRVAQAAQGCRGASHLDTRLACSQLGAQCRVQVQKRRKVLAADRPGVLFYLWPAIAKVGQPSRALPILIAALGES